MHLFTNDKELEHLNSPFADTGTFHREPDIAAHISYQQ
jgi:hypothetical protein